MTFPLHRNLAGNDPPFLLKIQHPVLDRVLESRIVVPVVQAPAREPITNVILSLRVLGLPHVAVVASLVAVPRHYLSDEVAYTEIDDDDVKRCLDRLFYGI